MRGQVPWLVTARFARLACMFLNDDAWLRVSRALGAGQAAALSHGTGKPLRQPAMETMLGSLRPPCQCPNPQSVPVAQHVQYVRLP